MNNPEYYIGLLSGTSIDSIDAAIVHFKHPKQINILHTHSHPIPPDLKAKTLALSQSGHTSLKQIGELDSQWGHLFADSVLSLLEKTKVHAKKIIAIGSHGQTLWHQPKGDFPFTIQIGDPHIIAKKTEILTIADFRRGDMALGGQGAPLAPAFHQHYFQHPDIDRVIVNLGGISNISYLPSDPSQPIIGYDTGPANSLLDSWCMLHQKKPFDENGQWAQTGEIQPSLLNLLLSDPYFAKAYPKSTGKDYFNINFLTNILKSIPYNIEDPYRPQDVQATLIEFTALTLCNAIKMLPLSIGSQPSEIILCGGGAHNTYLSERIQHHLGSHFKLYQSAHVNMDPNWVEAALFAWLAYSNIENTTLDYTAITGASKPSILGIRCLP